MTTKERSILIDARVNALPGGHGLARSVVKLAEHIAPGPDGLPVRVLVNPGRPQLFPLDTLAARAELVGTDIALGAVHRSVELARLIRSVGASVLYVPYPMFTPLIRPCPMVVTIHDCTIESDTGFAGGWHRRYGLKLATRVVLTRSRAVTAPTRASLDDIRRHYPSAPPLALVPNGVDTAPFTSVAARAVTAAREEYRLPERFVLAVGAHRPHKNHGVLLRALTRMPADVSLVIVGYLDPNFHDPLPRLIDDLGLRSRVLLIPEVADDLLPAVYRAAGVFAFPSLAEGYGLPVLEAMAAGVPVVASDIPVLAEVCGPAAQLLPPHDEAAWASAMMRILERPEVAADMVAVGSAVVAERTWERGASALRAVLISVATGKRPDRLPGAPVPAGERPRLARIG